MTPTAKPKKNTHTILRSSSFRPCAVTGLSGFCGAGGRESRSSESNAAQETRGHATIVSTRTPSPKSERVKLNANENANAAPTSVSAPETVPLENVSNQEMSSTEDPIPTHAPLANHIDDSRHRRHGADGCRKRRGDQEPFVLRDALSASSREKHQDRKGGYDKNKRRDKAVELSLRAVVGSCEREAAEKENVGVQLAESHSANANSTPWIFHEPPRNPRRQYPRRL